MSSDPTQPRHHTNLLMNLIVSLLAPIFFGVSNGDIQMARMAAIGTVNDYRARNQSDLIAIAQIIAFGLAALWALSRSMEDRCSVPDSIEFGRAANALARSAELSRRAMAQNQATSHSAHTVPEQQEYQEPPPEPAPSADDVYPVQPTMFLSPEAEAQLAAESEARLHATGKPRSNIRPQANWADAMLQEASLEQEKAMMQAALNASASQPLNGQTLP